MNHPESLDPLLDDLIFQCGCFRDYGDKITSIITLSGVGDTAWGEYRNEVAQVLEDYPREYKNLQKGNSAILNEMSKPPKIYLEEYNAVEE